MGSSDGFMMSNCLLCRGIVGGKEIYQEVVKVISSCKLRTRSFKGRKVRRYMGDIVIIVTI